MGRQNIQHLMQQHQLMPETYQFLHLFQHKEEEMALSVKGGKVPLNGFHIRLSDLSPPKTMSYIHSC